MNEKTRELFRTLTELNGAPGFEHDVRQFVRERITPVTDEIVTDGLGSIFGKRTGDATGPKVMVAGHMDEVAFMVTQITKNGMLRIQPLGGWWSQVLLAQRFSICTDNGVIPGVIASIPPHLLTEEVRNKPMAIKDMFIDIGADSKEEAESFGVRPGIPAVPFFPFTPMANPKKIMAKAWDNRYGVGMAIELLEETTAADHPNILFSVQRFKKKLDCAERKQRRHSSIPTSRSSSTLLLPMMHQETKRNSVNSDKDHCFELKTVS